MIVERAIATRTLERYLDGTLARRSDEGRGPLHAAYLLESIVGGHVSDEAKANRWIGYAHAILVECRWATLDELRAMTKAVIVEQTSSQPVETIL